MLAWNQLKGPLKLYSLRLFHALAYTKDIRWSHRSKYHVPYLRTYMWQCTMLPCHRPVTAGWLLTKVSQLIHTTRHHPLPAIEPAGASCFDAVPPWAVAQLEHPWHRKPKSVTNCLQNHLYETRPWPPAELLQHHWHPPGYKSPSQNLATAPMGRTHAVHTPPLLCYHKAPPPAAPFGQVPALAPCHDSHSLTTLSTGHNHRDNHRSSNFWKQRDGLQELVEAPVHVPITV